MDIEQNMLRNRAKGIPKVTDEMWEEVNEHNREMVQEYFDSNKHLSKQSIKQYTSALRIFFYYVKANLKNKELYKIKKRDFLKYWGWLQDYNLSSSALKFKKSAVSTLCIFIENIIAEDEEDYENFRNFTKAVKDIPNNKVYEKVVVTKDEYDFVIKYLLENKKYLGLAWFSFAFNTGSRKEEIRQIRTEVLSYENNGNFYESHTVRGKGRGEDGKQFKIMINKECMGHLKLYNENRGYEHSYMFTTRHNGTNNQISSGWANDFCKNTISELLGRRVNPHILRASACTYQINQGKDIKAVSKHLLHHGGVAVTELYIVRDETEDKNSLFE